MKNVKYPQTQRLLPFGYAVLAFLLAFFLMHQTLTRVQAAGGAQMLLSAGKTTLAVNETVIVGIGMDSGTVKVTGVDAVLMFNSNVLQLVGGQIGNTTLKTLVPGANNALDPNRAVQINQTDPTQSTVSVGVFGFDQSNDQLTASVSGTVDPATNPLVTLTFKAISAGQTSIMPKFTSGGTDESNIVSLDTGDVVDIMASPTSTLNIAVVVSSPTPTPVPTPSPTATPTPTPSPTGEPTPTPSPTPSPSPTACSVGNVNNDSHVDIVDIMLVASRWNSHPGDGKYDALYDRNHDGTISIVDIQMVANAWGANCP